MPQAGVNYVAVVVAAITPSGMSGGAMAKTTLGSFIGALVIASARLAVWG